MPFGDGTGPLWAGRTWRGRGLGYLATGLPGWARGWPRGYCWYYYQQTGTFPPWSPWAIGQSQTSQGQLSYLETIKAALEEQLKVMEEQISKLKRKEEGD